MIETCIIGYGAINCTDDCSKCGFNPDVAAKRKAAIRSQRKPEPPKTAQLVNLNDVLTAVDERIEYAKKRRDSETLNGETLDVAYWNGRVDEAQSIRAALEKMGDDDNADA